MAAAALPPSLPDSQPIKPVDCIYQDKDLLVLIKPAGLLCVPGRGPDKQDCLSARAQAQWPDALIVHRLDMATSGLVLMARSLQVQRALSAQFEQRLVHKRYQAIVFGTPEANDVDHEGWSLIDLPIAADWERRPLRIIHDSGKPSQTRWRIAAAATTDPALPPGCSRLDLEPITGRTHQLRVHLKATGHAILGDALYAVENVLAMAPRLLLHACELRLHHPVTLAPMHWLSPPDF